MKILLVFALTTCLSSFALAEVSSSDVSATLDQMVKEGTISELEAAKARIKMKALSADQWSSLNKQAATIAAAKQTRNPASVKDIGASANGDLDGAQFQQIKDDVKKIVPQFQDQD